MARPRQHAPEALHAQVMAACDAWLQGNSVHTLSLRSLARDVGCAPSTLLKLYGSFSNLLQYVNIETLDRMGAAVAGLEEAEPEPQLKALATAYWQYAQHEPYRWQMLFEYPLAEEGELDERQNHIIGRCSCASRRPCGVTSRRSPRSRRGVWRAPCGAACTAWCSLGSTTVSATGRGNRWRSASCSTSCSRTTLRGLRHLPDATWPGAARATPLRALLLDPGARRLNDNLFKNVLLLLLTFVAVPRYGWDTGCSPIWRRGCSSCRFFLFSAWGGTLADHLDKQRLVRRLKLLELATMLAAAAAVWFELFALLLALLFMMGTQSALFGPVKYAILPQHLAATELVKGNAWVNLGTFVSILLARCWRGCCLPGWCPGPRGDCAGAGGGGAGRAGRQLWGAAGAAQCHRACRLAAAIGDCRGAARRAARAAAAPGADRHQFLLVSGRLLFDSATGLGARDVAHGEEGAVSFLLGAFAFGVGAGALLCARLSAGAWSWGWCRSGCW